VHSRIKPVRYVECYVNGRYASAYRTSSICGWLHILLCCLFKASPCSSKNCQRYGNNGILAFTYETSPICRGLCEWWMCVRISDQFDPRVAIYHIVFCCVFCLKQVFVHPKRLRIDRDMANMVDVHGRCASAYRTSATRGWLCITSYSAVFSV
jgi:hypothetical protein